MFRPIVLFAVTVQSLLAGNPAVSKATVEGQGMVCLLRATRPAGICKPGAPLTFRDISVYRVSRGGTFDLRGVIRSTEEGGNVY